MVEHKKVLEIKRAEVPFMLSGYTLNLLLSVKTLMAVPPHSALKVRMQVASARFTRPLEKLYPAIITNYYYQAFPEN